MSKRELSGGAAGQDPVKGFVEVAENFDAAVALRFADDFKHAREAKGSVTGNQDGAAGSGGKQVVFGEGADVVGADGNFGDVTAVEQLRERGVEFRIGREFLVMSECFGTGDYARSSAHDQVVDLIDFVKGGHGDC